MEEDVKNRVKNFNFENSNFNNRNLFAELEEEIFNEENDFYNEIENYENYENENEPIVLMPVRLMYRASESDEDY